MLEQHGYRPAVRVVIIGASGNVGTALLEALHRESVVTDVVAVARRLPAVEGQGPSPAVEWRSADISRDDLDQVVVGADVVVHLAWLFHPTHRPSATWDNNVIGTVRLLAALERCRVPALIYSSSVGAYSPRTSSDLVDESWPTHGASPASYTREKAYIERLLDAFQARVPDCRVVRMRPAFVFHERAASQQRRLFGGPFVPGSLVRPSLVPVLPLPSGLLMQAVHANDVGRAFAAGVVSSTSGAFNLCADEVLEGKDLASLFDARPVSIPPKVLRVGLRAAWTAHTVPAPPDLFDALMRLPMMSNGRAKKDLGWSPQVSASDALQDLLAGLRRGAGHPTPPLDAEAGGPARSEEFGSGVGSVD